MGGRPVPRLGRLLRVASLLAVLAVVVAVVVAFAFSVRVTGKSMEPTISEGDRLVTNPLGRDDVERFDVVEADAGDRDTTIVKRVIGMPGDRLLIRGDAIAPVVLVRPKGASSTYVVTNPTWDGRIGLRSQSCCDGAGRALTDGVPGRWVTVPESSYWLVGDNWAASDDSRHFGFVTASEIEARIAFRLLPLGSLGPLAQDVELVEQGASADGGA